MTMQDHRAPQWSWVAGPQGKLFRHCVSLSHPWSGLTPLRSQKAVITDPYLQMKKPRQMVTKFRKTQEWSLSVSDPTLHVTDTCRLYSSKKLQERTTTCLATRSQPHFLEALSGLVGATSYLVSGTWESQKCPGPVLQSKNPSGI
jgi:hypothetical protein